MKIRLYLFAVVVLSGVFTLLISITQSQLIRGSVHMGRLMYTHYAGPKHEYTIEVIDFDQHTSFSVEPEFYPEYEGFQAVIDEQHIFSSKCFARNDAQMCTAPFVGIFDPNQLNKIDNIKQFWDGRYRDPVLSPDGTRIAFGAVNQRTQDPPTYQQDVYVANLDGTSLLNLTISRDLDGGFIAWSPHSKQIVFTCSNLNSLCITDVDGSFLQKIEAPHDTNVFPIAWSPDGRQIVFQTVTKDYLHAELYILNADGSNMHRLLEVGPARQWRPKWSPDGSKIIFFSTETDYRGCVFVVNADGSDLHPLSPALNGRVRGMVWSPDSQNVAYFFETYYGSNAFLYLVDLNRGDVQKIASVSAYIMEQRNDPELFWIP